MNGVITLNPSSGFTEAVTEPDLISVLISASSVRADFGIRLKYVPSAYMYEPESINKPPLTSDTKILPLTDTEPVKCDAIDAVNAPASPNEDVNGVVTTNPSTGETDAVTEPDLISNDMRASSVNAERGIFLKYLPSPKKLEDDSSSNAPLVAYI